MVKTETSKSGWYFLLVMIVIYTVASIIKPDFLVPALKFFWSVIIKIIPVLALAFMIMFIINYFITSKWLVSHLGKGSGIKTWLIAIISGIISTGPIYMWYPMLSELKEKGVRQGFIATFLYSRAIKPALIPLMVFYFGLAFTVTIIIVMIIFSIIQGELIEKIIGG